MTLEAAILSDLAAGQSTAASVADRLRIQPEAAEIILKRLRASQQVTSFDLQINGQSTGLHVFKLIPLS